METITINKTQTKETLVQKISLEQCNDVEDIAMISVDNTQTFENEDLHELYVSEWEQVACATKKIMEACKYYGITTINVLEEHPTGHISLAANYKNKKPYEMINYFEVAGRTDKDNGLSERAQFTVAELKSFLKGLAIKWESQKLWPDHSIKWTQWIELTSPLKETDFDLKIIKWTNPAKEAYSWFDDTTLDEELKSRWKKILIWTWVATDYCEWKTALDAQNKWYQVYLINEAIRWVAKETTDAMIETLKDAWVIFISKSELFEILKEKFA